jgi:hypothetical protein
VGKCAFRAVSFRAFTFRAVTWSGPSYPAPRATVFDEVYFTLTIVDAARVP